jgi:hypothetical protein
MSLPDKLIERTLNSKQRRIERSHRLDEVPLIHVSSLIKSSPSDMFCAREFVLKYAEGHLAAGAGIPPKFSLLYAVGHFYGQYIVDEFLRRNPEYGQYAWGDWSCICGKAKVYRQTLPKGRRCKHCHGELTRYHETDLFDRDHTVVGHADLIMFYEGTYYIYEFKSIERADIVFDEMQAPLGDHVAQASNYYYMLRAEGLKVSKALRFVYVDRSMTGLYTTLPFKELYARVVAADRLEEFYNRAKLVHSSVKKHILPPRICSTIKCQRAKLCPVAVSCFNRKQNTFKVIR